MFVEFEGEKYRYVYNLQGDVVGLASNEGILVVEYKYDAWGTIVTLTGQLAEPLGRVSIFTYIMHDKFCIIDLKTVLHGTFNWTVAANYNKETMSIDRNRETAERFADEFLKLKRLAL